MKTIIKSTLLAVCTLLLLFGIAQNLSATISTRPTLNYSANSVKGLQWNYTWAASADTMRTGVFKWEESAKGKNTVGQLWIETSTLNGDSISLAVRYEISLDGSNWQVFTLGTDSTTWTTTLSGTNYKVNVIDIEQATHGGYVPYARIEVWGHTTSNLAGTKVKVIAISQ